MAAVLKTANGESRSWVQIPPLPPVLLLCGKSVRDAKFRLRRSQRSDTFMLAISDDRPVSAGLHIPMDKQPPALHIQRPILGNTRSSVKRRFRTEVEGQAGISDLYYQARFLGPRVSGSKVLAFLRQNDEIGHRFVRWIVFRTSIGTSWFTNRNPKICTNHSASNIAEFACGRFFPILLINSPSTNSSFSCSNTPDASRAAHSVRVQCFRGGSRGTGRQGISVKAVGIRST
jgi:hypothetical protein